MKADEDCDSTPEDDAYNYGYGPSGRQLWKPSMMMQDAASRTTGYCRYCGNGTFGSSSYQLAIKPKQKACIRSFLTSQKTKETVMQINWSCPASKMEEMKPLLWNRQFYPLEMMSHLWKSPNLQMPTHFVTVPAKWEQPYLASWDTALHCLCLSSFDQRQAMRELMLLLSLVRPNGSIYNDEYRPEGVTPPLIVLAAIDVYGKCTQEEQRSLGPKIYGCLQRHLSWWLKRKDPRGVPLIDGGVCGVDYVSLFPREQVETGEGLIWAIFFLMRFMELAVAIYSTPGCSVTDQIAGDLPALVRCLGRLCAAFAANVTVDSGLFYPYWLDAVAASAKTEADASLAPSSSSNSSDGPACSDLHLKGESVSVTSSPSDAGKCHVQGEQLHYNSFASFSSIISNDGSFASFSGTPLDAAGSDNERSCARQRCHWLHAYCYLPAICCCSLPNLELPNLPDCQLTATASSNGGPSAASTTRLEDLFAAVFNSPVDESDHEESRPPHIFTDGGHEMLFVSLINSRELTEMLEQVLSECHFLAPYGIRTMSLLHSAEETTAKVTCAHDGQKHQLLVQQFCSGASVSSSYGGNTNWYGGINLPYNYLLLEALRRWSIVLNGKFDLIESPSYTGKYRRLGEIVHELASRNVALFLPKRNGIVPCTGEDAKQGLLFYETFDGDTGRGHGAAHKGGWSAIIARILLLMSEDN